MRLVLIRLPAKWGKKLHLTRLKLRAAVLTRNCLPVESVQERRGRWENVSNNAKRYRPRHEAQQTSVFQRSRFAETLEPELRARVCEWRRHRYDRGHTYHSIRAVTPAERYLFFVENRHRRPRDLKAVIRY